MVVGIREHLEGTARSADKIGTRVALRNDFLLPFHDYIDSWSLLDPNRRECQCSDSPGSNRASSVKSFISSLRSDSPRVRVTKERCVLNLNQRSFAAVSVLMGLLVLTPSLSLPGNGSYTACLTWAAALACV